MARLRLVKREHSLVYGMRLFADEVIPEGEHPRVTIELPDGRGEVLTLHVIQGGREEIKRKLLESVDAFFAIHEDDVP
jgi:hypothetical protein